jgi:uncharacterized protein (DUF427 family)
LTLPADPSKTLAMPYPEITRATQTIHNPADPRHFMRLKPVARKITIRLGGMQIASTGRALRLVEVSNDVYDPAFYIPMDDVTARLDPVPDRSTHCPLKGDAAYFSVNGWQPAGDSDYLAWSYATTFEFARELQGLVAFNPAHVSITDSP